MAEVTTLAGSGLYANPTPREYMVEVEIDMAAAATAKGSALVATDTINAWTIPANTVVLEAGIQAVDTPAGGTGTVLDLGIKGGVTDRFVDGFAYDSASAGDYAALETGNGPYMAGAGGVLNVLIQAATTVSTSGTIRVWAVMRNVEAIGDKEADEATRDQLG